MAQIWQVICPPPAFAPFLFVNISKVIFNWTEITFQLNYSQHTLFLGPLTKLGTFGALVTLTRNCPLERQYRSAVGRNRACTTEPVLVRRIRTSILSPETWNLLTKKWTPRQVVEGIQCAGNPTSPAILVCLPSTRLGGVILTNQAVRAQNEVRRWCVLALGIGAKDP
jgi:hypothetical protein